MSSLSISTTSWRGGKAQGLPDIAFIGKAGSGKSSAAAFLAQLGYQTRSFAEPLRRFAVSLWGEYAANDREKLLALGECVRRLDPGALVAYLLAPLAPDCPVVVDDCRLEPEYWALKGAGFVFVRIAAPLGAREQRLRISGKWQSASQLSDATEAGLDGHAADYELSNDGPLTEFYEGLVAIINRERRNR